MENLLHGKLRASILDLKMGTTSITKNTPQHRYEEISQKDSRTTTEAHGLRVTSLVLKGQEG